jgi:hypothetical protein
MPNQEEHAMADLIESTLLWLDQRLSGRMSRPGDDGYTVATTIWAKPVGLMPRVVAHCRTAQDVQLAIRAARDADLRFRCVAVVTTGPVARYATAS